MQVLVDYTHAIPGDFSGDDLEAVASGIEFDTERWGSGFFAVVTDNPAIYGLAAQWQDATRSLGLVTDVFASRVDEAPGWLSSANDS